MANRYNANKVKAEMIKAIKKAKTVEDAVEVALQFVTNYVHFVEGLVGLVKECDDKK